MQYKKLIIRGISYSQTQSGAYALLLEDLETSVKLPVVIGNYEAQSISMGLEKDLKPPRPLTHDLFSKFVETAGYVLESVIIYQIIDGVFFSNINFKNKETQEDLIMDARTSDAVAMAVRFDAPIYTTEQVLTEAGILLDLIDSVTSEQVAEMPQDSLMEDESSLMRLSMEELQQKLDDAVKNEDFDEAVKVQEEMNRRKKKID